jgi:pimeloyl-ACP methyl ester carboxylesterase
MLREAWTILDGLPLFYRTNAAQPPQGARMILHIHGFAISGTYLVPTASRLASRYGVLVPDLPGFGRSIDPPRPRDIDQLADAVARLMDLQGLDHAVLLGNSLGCPITGALLDRHPARVEAAVLVSPAGGPHNLPLVRGIAQLLLDGTREPLAMAPIAIRDYVRYGVRPSLHLMRSMLRYPLVRRIAEGTLPVLVIIGDRDPLVDEEQIREQADRLPHVTALAIEGAAHAVNFSHADQLAHVVGAWLEGRPLVGDPAAKGHVRVFSWPAEGRGLPLAGPIASRPDGSAPSTPFVAAAPR